MKKSLFILALASITVHAADTPEAALEQLLQHILDGNGAQATALTHIAPELRAEGVDEAAIQAQLTQCYSGNAHQTARNSGHRLAAVRAEHNADHTQARLFATIRDKDGDTFDPAPLNAVKTAQNWQIDFVEQILSLCPDIQVGDPRAVAQRYLDAWQRGDVDAAFALTRIDEPYFTDLTPIEYLAETRKEFADFYQKHASRTLRLGDAAATINNDKAEIAVLNEKDGTQDSIHLQKTARGWRIIYW